MSFWNIFGGGIVGAIENVAMEMIETDKESAEAKAVLIKTLDPNGIMRRDISSTVRNLYSVYILLAMTLLLAQAFGVGEPAQVALAVNNITDLFVPITAMFSAIVGASFGVNGLNAHRDKK